MKNNKFKTSLDICKANFLISINENNDIGAIYAWTNEKINLYYNYLDLTEKKALCITSSADHILHAVLAGSTYIDAIDKNKLAKYYASLKIALIKRYNFNEFTKKFYKLYLRSDINLDELKEYLTKNEIQFWKKIFKNSNYTRIYKLDGYYTPVIQNCVYFNENTYNKLRYNLKKTKINFFDLDITKKNIGKILNNKYSAIYASNVYDFIKENKQNTYFENCYKLLENNGVLYNYHCINNPYIIENNYLIYDNMILTHYIDEDKKEYNGVSIYKKVY